VLADAVGKILSHSVLHAWLKDPSTPKHFRDAGHFWGIALGTPTQVIHARILDIDRTLEKAVTLLDVSGVDEVSGRHGKALFERRDIAGKEFPRDSEGAIRKGFGHAAVPFHEFINGMSVSSLRVSRAQAVQNSRFCLVQVRKAKNYFWLVASSFRGRSTGHRSRSSLTALRWSAYLSHFTVSSCRRF
jgi:hypothetical protein